MKNKNGINMTEGALLPVILRFALPLIATSLLQLVFNIADTVMVGRWGGDTPEQCTAAMAAVGSGTSLVNLFVNASLGLSVGCGITVAHRAAAGREDEMRAICHTAVTLAATLGFFALFLGFPLARPILAGLDTDAGILGDATAYLRAYLLGMPACVVYNFAAAILRARGDTVRPLLFLSAGGVINVLFNFFAVVILGMGAVGVGLATALAQWISCIMILIYMTRGEGAYRLSFRALGIKKEALLAILGAGIPAAVQSILFNASALLLQSAVNGFGPVVVAGNTAAMNVEGYIYTTQNALYHTAMTITAQCRGAGNLRRIGKAIRLSSLTVLVIGLSVGLFALLLGRPILSLYAPEAAEAVDAGYIRLLAVCPLYFLCGLMEVGTGALRGMGRSLLPTATSLIGCCLLRVLWVLTVFRWVSPTLEPAAALFLLYLAFPLSWILTATAQHILAARELRRLRRAAAEP